jgi:hypothetical protein
MSVSIRLATMRPVEARAGTHEWDVEFAVQFLSTEPITIRLRARGPLDRPNDALAHAYTLLARLTEELARAAAALSPEGPARP